MVLSDNCKTDIFSESLLLLSQLTSRSRYKIENFRNDIIRGQNAATVKKNQPNNPILIVPHDEDMKSFIMSTTSSQRTLSRPEIRTGVHSTTSQQSKTNTDFSTSASSQTRIGSDVGKPVSAAKRISQAD